MGHLAFIGDLNVLIRFDKGLKFETSALECLYSGQITLSTLLVFLLGLSSRMIFNYSELMLWRTDTEKTQYSFVGKVGQGIYPQGSDKTTDRMMTE